jgi:hypothetical protein
MEIDYEEELNFIKELTKLDLETIESVLDADMKFLESKGIAEVEE